MAGKEKRPRNAEATREAIEPATRRQFSRRGEGLFETAVIPHFNIDGYLEGDIGQFGERMAAGCVDRGAAIETGLDLPLAFLLSVGHEDFEAAISKTVETRLVGPLAGRIGGPDSRCRAALAPATLLGFGLLYRLAHVDALTEVDQDELKRKLADLIQHIVRDGDTSAADTTADRGEGRDPL